MGNNARREGAYIEEVGIARHPELVCVALVGTEWDEVGRSDSNPFQLRLFALLYSS